MCDNVLSFFSLCREREDKCVIMSFRFSVDFFYREREDKCVIMSFRFSVFVERQRDNIFFEFCQLFCLLNL
jgi:hypothetical protein